MGPPPPELAALMSMIMSLQKTIEILTAKLEKYESNDQDANRNDSQSVPQGQKSGSGTGNGNGGGTSFAVNFGETTGLTFGDNQGKSYRSVLSSQLVDGEQKTGKQNGSVNNGYSGILKKPYKTYQLKVQQPGYGQAGSSYGSGSHDSGKPGSTGLGISNENGNGNVKGNGLLVGPNPVLFITIYPCTSTLLRV